MSFQDLEARKAAAPPSRSPSQGVAAGIFQINTAVAGFRRLVDAIGTVKDSPDHRRKLQNARQRILELVKETSAKLKELNDSDLRSNVQASKKVEDAKLAREFQTTLLEVKKVHQLASERESTFPLPHPPISSLSDDQDIETESQSFIIEHQQRRQEVLFLDNEIAFNEAIIDERDQAIREIQNQIGEANEIFKDLAVLVHDQGVVIDDIQSNVDNSAAATTQSRVQLAKASKSVKSRSSWCWWLLAILLLALIIFFVFILI